MSPEEVAPDGDCQAACYVKSRSPTHRQMRPNHVVSGFELSVWCDWNQ
jgi:hypothetical protein